MEDLPGSSSGYSEDGGINSKNMSSGGGKIRKRNERQGEEKGREVVHVRARRGQATNSHSLAERVEPDGECSQAKPSGSFHYRTINTARSIVLANSASLINGKQRYV